MKWSVLDQSQRHAKTLYFYIALYRIQIVSRQRYSAKDAAVVSDCVRVCAEAPGRDSVCVFL